MKSNFKWVRVASRSLSNLSVLSVNGKDVAFIHKPKDTRTDKNAWRMFRILSEGEADFMGHNYSKAEACKFLQDVFLGTQFDRS
jgi:hypothetical protein